MVVAEVGTVLRVRTYILQIQNQPIIIIMIMSWFYCNNWQSRIEKMSKNAAEKCLFTLSETEQNLILDCERFLNYMAILHIYVYACINGLAILQWRETDEILH